MATSPGAEILVALHGFTHTGASWGPVTAALDGRYRVLAPDIRGHGAASDVEPVSLRGVVEDVRTVVAERPVVLAAYSMGARLALHAAIALGPTRVRRLVLIGGSPGLADARERAARRRADERLADELELLEIDELARRWATRTEVLAGQPPEVAAAAHADRLRSTPTGLARALRGLGTGALPSLWHRLGEIVVPVTLVVGERDAKFRGISGQMAPLITGPAEVVVVPDTGHAVHLEAPQRLAEIIASDRIGHPSS